jgi:hypothetical protein
LHKKLNLFRNYSKTLQNIMQNITPKKWQGARLARRAKSQANPARLRPRSKNKKRNTKARQKAYKKICTAAIPPRAAAAVAVATARRRRRRRWQQQDPRPPGFPRLGIMSQERHGAVRRARWP